MKYPKEALKRCKYATELTQLQGARSGCNHRHSNLDQFQLGAPLDDLAVTLHFCVVDVLDDRALGISASADL